MNRTKPAIASTITGAMILGSTIVLAGTLAAHPAGTSADQQTPSVEAEVRKVRGDGGGAIYFKD